MNKIAIISSVLFFVIACRENNNRQVNVNTIIDREGIYHIKGKNVFLDVRSENDLISYSLMSDTTKLLSNSGEISGFSAWFFLYDNLDNLYVHSSDAGTFVWVKNGNSYKKELINENYNSKSLPVEFYNNLPKSLKANLQNR
jgi:hypothetical protein